MSHERLHSMKKQLKNDTEKILTMFGLTGVISNTITLILALLKIVETKWLVQIIATNGFGWLLVLIVLITKYNRRYRL